MADSKLTRQQIYDRIRASSKDEFILEDMKRLGFWSKDDGEPGIPELLIRKEAALQKELNKLFEEKRKHQNKEAVLKEMRMKRMAEAKAKRETNKKKKEHEAFERAAAWKKKKENEIIYLGENVSTGLNHTENNIEKLQQYGLPVFIDETTLATAMGVDLKELRFLAFNRPVATISHYRKFYLPKKSGGKRLISAPMPRLKKIQYWILQHILDKVPVHKAANGFLSGHSIVTNATPHIGKDIVLNADVKDFFPSVHYKRVKGLLTKLGYAEKIATILALICTEAVTEEVEIDGKNYFVQKGERVLPQGAPTSPAITNILCYKLDLRLQGLADKLNCSYTRYADDITFSGSKEVNAQQLVWRVKKILQDEGFTVHPKKIRLMRKGALQEVTGVVVNEQLNIKRKDLHEFRALLHRLKTNAGKPAQWGSGSLVNSVLGYVNYVNMVNPVKGAKLKQQVDALLRDNKLVLEVKKENTTATGKNATTPVNGQTSTGTGDNKDDTGKPWWNIV
ncbi:MAG: reverse transcriptase domain-containing protein [Ferruginibacter sp.]